MENENILANLVRLGTVSTVDASKRKARVTFKDRDSIVSGWLYVLQHYDASLFINPDAEHSHTSACGGTSTFPDHDHERSHVTYWMPKVGDTVVALYLPVFNGDGFILGGI